MADDTIRFDDGASYEILMGRWSVLVGARFLEWIGVPDGARWLDIGCGNGAFTELVVGHCRPAEVRAFDPSPGQLDYARKRLAGCPYGPEKPTCVNCHIHCYGPRQREAMRVVMRHSGPRMLWRHPVLAIAHLVDGRRRAPPKPGGLAPAQGHQDQAVAPPD